MAKLACLILLSFAFVAHSSRQNCVHTVYVKTADVPYAGTDAKVSLNLYDNQGNVIEVPDLEKFGIMSNGHNYFEQNNLDIFAIRSKCLPSNNICKIVLSHDNTGSRPAWNVDYLEINSAGPQTLCNHRNFGIQQWLALDKYPYELSVTRDACGATNSGVSMDYEESHLELPIES